MTLKLSKLKLKDFRNYKNREFVFSEALTLVVGANTSGKTNLLEAIYLLASGESFRAQKIEEMVRWGAEVGHVSGEIEKPEKVRLAVALTRGVIQGERAQKRSYKVNGVAKRKRDFGGELVVVVFRPENLQLISGSPSVRRNYLDGVLFQVDSGYRRSLIAYEKALRRRNKLLDLIREGEVQRTVLAFWDQVMIKEGNVLTDGRREFIDFVNTKGKDGLRLVYDFSTISEKRLEQYENEEVAAGYTLVGPHKDDFFVESMQERKSRDLAVFGSRGEQRMAVLWLKLNELNFVGSKISFRPVLLLDDIFSELDEKHQRQVWGWCKKQQTIVTTTNRDLVKRKERVMILELNKKES